MALQQFRQGTESYKTQTPETRWFNAWLGEGGRDSGRALRGLPVDRPLHGCARRTGFDSPYYRPDESTRCIGPDRDKPLNPHGLRSAIARPGKATLEFDVHRLARLPDAANLVPETRKIAALADGNFESGKAFRK